MRRLVLAALAGILSLAPITAMAAGISTHVLDLVRGEGGKNLPVTLSIKEQDGMWRRIASAQTDENGRVRSFGDTLRIEPGLYKLTFDMSDESKPTHSSFFPEIDIVFRVTDPSLHFHVPVVLSPYGYSTYRGN